MLPVVSLIVVLSLSLLLTRIASVALAHTGMSREAARFQARSAFSGVGFTTSEAEAVVSHPVRRRIVMWLMLVGNVGIVTAMASLLLSFVGMSGSSGPPIELGILVGGVLLLLLLAWSQWVDRQLSRVISWALRRWTSIDVHDYTNLLHLRDDYGILEVAVDADNWLAGRTLGETRLSQEGVLVLGVQCPGENFIGAPGAETPIRAGDQLILYGRAPRIAELHRRCLGSEGDRSHAEARSERDEMSRREHAQAGR